MLFTTISQLTQCRINQTHKSSHFQSIKSLRYKIEPYYSNLSDTFSNKNTQTKPMIANTIAIIT